MKLSRSPGCIRKTVSLSGQVGCIQHHHKILRRIFRGGCVQAVWPIPRENIKQKSRRQLKIGVCFYSFFKGFGKKHKGQEANIGKATEPQLGSNTFDHCSKNFPEPGQVY